MLVLFATLKHIIEITCKATSFRFRRKKPCKINILDSLKLLNQAWNSVSETAIKNCFKKVKFFHSKLEDDLEETESNVNEDTEGIWESIEARCLIPKTFTFSEYAENDSQLQTREIITKSSILDDLRTT